MTDRDRYPALRALVGLEMKRTFPMVGRGLGMGGVFAGLLIVTGAFTLPRLAFILGVVGIAPVAGIPIAALRDKIDGGLEFLRFLPTSPQTHAMARLVSLALIAVPASLTGTVATALTLMTDVPGILGFRPLVGIFLALMVTLAVGGFLTTALVLRFELTQGSFAPLILVGAALVFDHFAERYVPDPVGTFTTLATHGWFLPALWVAGLAGSAALAWIAFSVAWRGIERFSPPRDRITW